MGLQFQLGKSVLEFGESLISCSGRFLQLDESVSEAGMSTLELLGLGLICHDDVAWREWKSLVRSTGLLMALLPNMGVYQHRDTLVVA